MSTVTGRRRRDPDAPPKTAASWRGSSGSVTRNASRRLPPAEPRERAPRKKLIAPPPGGSDPAPLMPLPSAAGPPLPDWPSCLVSLTERPGRQGQLCRVRAARRSVSTALRTASPQAAAHLLGGVAAEFLHRCLEAVRLEQRPQRG